MMLLDASTIAEMSDAILSLQRAVALSTRIPPWAVAPTTLFLARVCLGLDCHEFSSAPSHA
jgi:hypothetical protein